MANSASPIRLRPLGLIEQHSSARHSLGYYNNIGMTAIYQSSLTLNVGMLQTLVYRTLGGVLAQHPALTVTIMDEDTSLPYFLRLENIDLAKVVEFVPCVDVFDDVTRSGVLDQFLEDKHNARFSFSTEESPPWRLFILHEPEEIVRFVACFIYSHPVADGTSGFAFHRSFLSCLCMATDQTPFSATEKHTSSSNERFDHIVRTREAPMSPTLESLHALPLSILFILRSVWREYFARAPSGLWTGSKMTLDPAKRKSRFKSVCFSASTTEGLLKNCRHHTTSVTAALETALAAVVFSELDPHQHNILRVDGAMSLRRFLPVEHVDENSMGNWVSRYVGEHRRAQHATDIEPSSDPVDLFSWDEARRLKETIESELRKAGKDSEVGLLKFAGNLHDYFKGKIGKSRQESFQFTNPGVFRSDQRHSNASGWEIGKMVFSQSADVVGAPFEASVVTGEDGCLNVGFSWLEGIVEEAWMDKVIQSFEHIVIEISKETQ